jgi:hypothetical protein|nr:MAG TPA: hypothetical protein [Caudoviricetes sp.]
MKTKTLKDLNVKVTYNVGLSDVDVPEKVAQQLEQMADYGFSVCDSEISKYPDAFNWLSENISEEDALYWEYEVEIE